MAISLGLEKGDPFRLGARVVGNGVNFAVFALNADGVELCVFDASGERELARLPLPGWHAGVWHGFLPDAEAGLVYGFRAQGRFAPELGLRYNPQKLLVDPYARRLLGRYGGQSDYCDHLQEDPQRPDPRDNGHHAIKAIVADDRFDWGADKNPAVLWRETVIYEVHVKGFTQRHPGIPEHLRGTYAGLAHPLALDWLQKLGVTTLSLLPIAACADESRLLGMEKVNYWAYNPVALMAPEQRYAAGDDALHEFKAMVKALHLRGIEVLLDVVYNHTAEGGMGGPTFNLRGLDNATYYRLAADSQYENWTGCGNTLDCAKPRTLQLVLDAMRFWVDECHIDGFRFDLAPIMARGVTGRFDACSPFFGAITQDPLLSKVKLVAEPWDIGPDGYRVGDFPAGWAEWNDKFRDTVRAFWTHQWPTRGEFARRLTGSTDVFERRGRMPWASVNFITAHDGFTLRDLLSYNHKHNEANGEENRDGHGHNHSWNCGVEGATEDERVNEIRGRLHRAMLATLLFSQGTPMLLGGDELGRTQGGNNNAYCQDNEMSWYDWANADHGLAAFTARLIALRKRYPALRYARWFSPEVHRFGRPDVSWRNAEGRPMTSGEWDGKERFSLNVEIGPEDDPNVCLLLVNAEAQQVSFALRPGRWSRLLDTSDPEAGEALFLRVADVPANSIWLLVLNASGRVTW